MVSSIFCCLTSLAVTCQDRHIESYADKFEYIRIVNYKRPISNHEHVTEHLPRRAGLAASSVRRTRESRRGDVCPEETCRETAASTMIVGHVELMLTSRVHEDIIR